jgi:hypothetical protein
VQIALSVLGTDILLRLPLTACNSVKAFGPFSVKARSTRYELRLPKLIPDSIIIKIVDTASMPVLERGRSDEDS